MSDFLLEIGTEEIPHWMIKSALKDLALRISPDLLGAIPKFDATPRRLVVWASGVPENQLASDTLVQGPSISAGALAAEKFATKMGASVADLQIRETPKGKYYSYLKRDVGYGAVFLLARHLPGNILAVPWPKTMYWKQKNEAFIRPIRWIVALFGDEVIPFEIAGVKSSNITRGHRQLGSSSIPVTIANYESELRKNFVILSSDERRKKIETEAAALGAKPDADLLETLTFVTEFPTAIRGDFDPSFLTLPSEVLSTVLKHHQKTFSIESAPGVLAPHFVAIMNTSADPDGWVKLGNERVIKARFNDARFFFDVDQHKTLADRYEDLAKVTFHQQLGSYKDKVERMLDIVMNVFRRGDLASQRAALLCKSDLTTEMVKEFTDLQGIIGGLYAREQREDERVATAIYEHYKPLSMEDSIPSTIEGQIVSLADKIDTLNECFTRRMVPTGSKDPFALRRAAQGVVRILVEGQVDFVPDDLFTRELLDFMRERVQYYFREIRGYKYDEVNAVLAAGMAPLVGVEPRLKALSEVRSTENFEPLAASFKRINNILKQSGYRAGRSITEADFLSPAERDLFAELQRVIHAAQEYFGSGEYLKLLQVIASTRPTVDRFFETTMVMDPDQDTRERRLELLYRINQHFNTIADFSEIVTAGDKTN